MTLWTVGQDWIRLAVAAGPTLASKASTIHGARPSDSRDCPVPSKKRAAVPQPIRRRRSARVPEGEDRTRARARDVVAQLLAVRPRRALGVGARRLTRTLGTR